MKHYAKTPEIINRFVAEYDFLSNFYPAKVYYNGSIFFNSEAAYDSNNKVKIVFACVDYNLYRAME